MTNRILKDAETVDYHRLKPRTSVTNNYLVNAAVVTNHWLVTTAADIHICREKLLHSNIYQFLLNKITNISFCSLVLFFL